MNKLLIILLLFFNYSVSYQVNNKIFQVQPKNTYNVQKYISNNKFVHASTSMGVVISDLDEAYWSRRFVKAGRLL